VTDWVGVSGTFGTRKLHRRVGHDWTHLWIGLDWIGLDWVGWLWPRYYLVIIAAQLMLFLSNCDLWTLNDPGFTTIRSQH